MNKKIIFFITCCVVTILNAGFDATTLQQFSKINQITKKQLVLAREITKKIRFDASSSDIESVYFFGLCDVDIDDAKIKRNNDYIKINLFAGQFYGLNAVSSLHKALKNNKTDEIKEQVGRLLAVHKMLLHFAQDLGCLVPHNDYQKLHNWYSPEIIITTLCKNQQRFEKMEKLVNITSKKSSKLLDQKNDWYNKIIFSNKYITSQGSELLDEDLNIIIQEGWMVKKFTKLVEKIYSL